VSLVSSRGFVESALGTALFLTIVAPSTSSAQVLANEQEARWLVRWSANLGTGSHTIETRNCRRPAGAPPGISADSYLYVLQDNGTGNYIYRGHDDDGNPSFCSKVTFTNSTGSTKLSPLAFFDAGRSRYVSLLG